MSTLCSHFWLLLIRNKETVVTKILNDLSYFIKPDVILTKWKTLIEDRILIFSLLNLISEGGHMNVMDLLIPLIIEVMLI